ncbi:VOC family protein [Thalassotalea euphylliae]|uniref:VOC family protein n=1 Tax=Thalassotalea euphylliae TaxID=1655234 RepID=UPI003638400B
MTVKSIRFCHVTEQSEKFIQLLNDIGVKQKDVDCGNGAIFDAGESWVEIWQQNDEMPAGTMLQIIVDDINYYAQHAREHGVELQGPFEQHGEKIFFTQSPDGLPISIQSLSST